MNKGEIINGYTIVRKLGEGGMASVWQVEKDGKYYAMKVCASDDEELKKRFQREYRLMTSINDPHVLKAFEEGQYNGCLFFIEEIADCSLKDLVERGLTTKQKYQYGLQVCQGLSVIHQMGVSHRDIKPDNVLMVNGIAKISDFGIGRFIERDTTTITVTAQSMGTYDYAAPELYDGDGAFKEGSPTIDIFALGSLLYYVFSDGSLPRFFNYRQVSADIFPVLQKCREIAPTDRYQTVDEVIIAIHKVKEAKNRYMSMASLYQDRNKLSDAELAENALDLLYSSGGLSELIPNFNIFKSLWPAVYRSQPNCADDIAQFIIRTFDSDHSYWLQFQDTEVMARMAVLLCPVISNPATKVALLEKCFSSSLAANRWDALRDLHNNLFLKWNKDTIQPYITYIQEHSDDFFRYEEVIDVKMPQLVKSLIRK